jgi:hypothetical protein
VLLRDRLKVPPTQLGPGLQVRFSRWVGRTASIVLLRPVRVGLLDPQKKPVDPRLAPRVLVRGTDGSRLTLASGRVSWVPAVRAIVRPGARWRERRVSFAVQEVLARGANVVNRAQQHFVPARQQKVDVHVLFFEMRFRARDALFGTAIGTSVELRFPDGHTERVPLGSSGERAIAGLPRGDYLVNVSGPGISMSRPVVLSRSQDVGLQIITWLDVALGVALVLLALLALSLVRRWLIRRSSHARIPIRAEHDHG